MAAPSSLGPFGRRIEEKLRAAFAPVELEIENESHKHSVPRGSETHFLVLVVSAAFEGLGPVERHRRVNAALREEFGAGLHALSIRARTPGERARDLEAGRGEAASPPCLGGSKAEGKGS